ncbi:S26 family signal peptidase [Pseudonocardia sp. TRM90224]|uniref:S26 family signal peptidase n=1 Tax=Pseudonocardia sp. TRM90224 TaxID=2812678 RepID=UPI001E4E339D|nr:S26 family signal peptidase [Pseudonocardia sp. TRM90224]
MRTPKPLVVALLAVGAVSGAVIWWLRRNWVVITVEGPSMEPTFYAGDRVAVRRTPRFKVSTGDVVVTRQVNGPPGRERPGSRTVAGSWMIKRVGAMSGEPVPAGIPVPDEVVPPGKLVLLGDNSNASFDSRVNGYFPEADLLGGVVRKMSRA